MSRRILLGVVGLGAAALVACSSDSSDPATSPGGGTASVVPPGKADDFFSTHGQEYTVTGRTRGAIESTCLSASADSPDPAKACALQAIGLKNFAIAWFLNQYMIDKQDAPNQDWGGFTAMTRPESYDALEIGAADPNGAFEYRFTSELSGPFDLLDKLPTTPCGDGEKCFDLEIPVLATSTLQQNEWYRKAPYNAYKPETYTGEKETITLSIKPFPRSNDAYLEYGKLFSAEQLAKAGGALKIGMFVGWDYYDARYDLQTAKEVYRWLVTDRGFKSPVGSYDQLGIDSGDLEKTIRVLGKEVPVRVKLVHPGQGDPANPTFAGRMKAELVKAFAERQVVLFEGHAGPLYGFALANWNATEAGELDDTELPFLSIPENFYQVVMASGCDTYMVADSLYLNPVKQGRVDLDVITTTSFSNAAGKGRTSKVVMDAVFNQEHSGELKPKMYGELLRKLNQEYWMTPIYGVHGIDDNPRVNPLADFSKSCEPCSSHASCGGFDTLCVDLGGGDKRCAAKCESNNDCPSGYSCFDMREGNTIISKNCAPTTLSCSGGDTTPAVPWINEIHYDNAGTDIDEGVELAGKAGLDLTGYVLWFYNGSPGQLRTYKSVALEGKIPSQAGGYGTLWFPVAYIQNGGADTASEPDGIALVDALGKVVQFLSYEGAFTPTNGPAAGMVSTNIGVFEHTGSPVGQSLSLVGTGSAYASFSWQSGVAASRGAPNPGQTLQ
jgi:hypothetical protein